MCRTLYWFAFRKANCVLIECKKKKKKKKKKKEPAGRCSNRAAYLKTRYHMLSALKLLLVGVAMSSDTFFAYWGKCQHLEGTFPLGTSIPRTLDLRGESISCLRHRLDLCEILCIHPQSVLCISEDSSEILEMVHNG